MQTTIYYCYYDYVSMQVLVRGGLFWCRKVNSRNQTYEHSSKQASIQSIKQFITLTSYPNAYGGFWCNVFGNILLYKWFCEKNKLSSFNLLQGFKKFKFLVIFNEMQKHGCYNGCLQINYLSLLAMCCVWMQVRHLHCAMALDISHI
jgi:hypothetical protein